VSELVTNLNTLQFRKKLLNLRVHQVLYGHKMEMQQIIEIMLADSKAWREKVKAETEAIRAETKAIRARTKAMEDKR
jgi:hypothetical protein